MMIRCVQSVDGTWIPLDFVPNSHKAPHQRVNLNQVDFSQASPLIKLFRNFPNLPI